MTVLLACDRIADWRNPEITLAAMNPKIERDITGPLNYYRVAVAEVGFITLFPFAIVETAISAVAKLFAIVLFSSNETHKRINTWMFMSVSSILITPLCAITNLLANRMPSLYDPTGLGLRAAGPRNAAPYERQAG